MSNKKYTPTGSLPQGYVKMDLVLTFKNEQIPVWEDIIIRLLIRDYYLYYSLRPKFKGDTWTEIHFYCRPQDVCSIAYVLGHYAQVAFNTYRDEQLNLQSHAIPKGYPGCIKLSYIKTQKQLNQTP